MKNKTLFALPMLALGILVLCAAIYAQGKGQGKGQGQGEGQEEGHKLGPYKLLTTITTPGEELVGFDISWVDSAAGRYYLANRGTGTTPARPNITVIDT